MKNLFTSESISYGHPDRVCDTIVNAILSKLLQQDPNSRVGLEALATKNFLALSGEVTTKAIVDYCEVAADTIRMIGYNDNALDFSCETFSFLNLISTQSPDIAQGVDRADGEIGAGDQGIMFGFACNETPQFLPLSAAIANALTTRYQLVQAGHSYVLSPDAKSQVTIDVDSKKVDTIIFAASHKESSSQEDVQTIVRDLVIDPVIRKFFGISIEELIAKDETKILINTTGKFVVCGPASDAGVVGRKLVVDSYGGHARIGGGCTNGKDPSKVDASAARAARHAALNLVAAGVCDKCEIQLSYAIGVAKPVSINVNTFGTSNCGLPDVEIAQILSDNYDFSPSAIIKNLSLCDVDYTMVTYCGQFGNVNNPIYLKGELINDFPWERLNLVPSFEELFF